MIKVLWVHSSDFETESYREELSRRGYSVDRASGVVEALPKLDAPPYGAVFLSPYFLSWGDAEIKPPSDMDTSDTLSPGLWLYDKIREGRNSRSPLFLVPIGLKRQLKIGDELDRLQERMQKDTGPVFLRDLLDTLPGDLCDLVDKTLRK